MVLTPSSLVHTLSSQTPPPAAMNVSKEEIEPNHCMLDLGAMLAATLKMIPNASLNVPRLANIFFPIRRVDKHVYTSISYDGGHTQNLSLKCNVVVF